jgi:hypothetical protein
MCTAYSLAETQQPPPLPPHCGSYTRALLVSQDRRQLLVTRCISANLPTSRHTLSLLFLYINLLIISAVSGVKASEEQVVQAVKEVLVDSAVWKVLEDLYTKFLQQKPRPAPLAVLLSIL